MTKTEARLILKNLETNEIREYIFDNCSWTTNFTNKPINLNKQFPEFNEEYTDVMVLANMERKK